MVWKKVIQKSGTADTIFNFMISSTIFFVSIIYTLYLLFYDTSRNAIQATTNFIAEESEEGYAMATQFVSFPIISFDTIMILGRLCMTIVIAYFVVRFINKEKSEYEKYYKKLFF